MTRTVGTLPSIAAPAIAANPVLRSYVYKPQDTTLYVLALYRVQKVLT